MVNDIEEALKIQMEFIEYISRARSEFPYSVGKLESALYKTYYKSKEKLDQ